MKATPFVHVSHICRQSIRCVIRPERVLHGMTLVLLAVVICLGPFAAPCADWIDGPCQTNWASGAQWMLLPIALAFAITSLVLIMRASQRRARQAFRQLGHRSNHSAHQSTESRDR